MEKEICANIQDLNSLEIFFECMTSFGIKN